MATDLDRPWTSGTVRTVLTNEKYIGNNVYNRSSFKLKKLHVENPPDMWVRKKGAFEGIVLRDPKTDLLIINDEMVVRLVLARCQPQADVTLAVRLDPDNRDELDYYLLPWIDLPRQEILLCNRSSIAFEAFRFEDLGFFYGMAERVGIRRKWGQTE